ncbi:hypothetical protein DYB38_008808 [Aphanomyces astaci]|uniref:Uncharacterized protein n=1 Tax=Aphanomyces astaci TaxID=112090 RepID=A0A397FGU8_APHAT|nr:hypothetical protein DYB36_009532 [Aphanomyces astaci]RHY53291.1 hypothetical protein DYB34_011637 [Aphanomyces astaci]RHY64781.1 hypothetical protein DYB38_008808 [Aphanomyces astaci]RHZ32253.1 hypothetical protein DYB31_003613 [Aphanomyces astaci]
MSYEHEIIHVEDKWAELLPTRIPLRYAFFRYLGFCIKVHGSAKNGHTSSKALKPASRASLRIKISSSQGVVLDEKIPAHFKDGVYYVQDISLQDEGLHTIHVWIESRFLTSVKPFAHELHVHQFMRLHDDPGALFAGPYGSLRKAIDPYLYKGRDYELRDNLVWTDDLLHQCLARSKSKLRTVDSKVRGFMLRAGDKREHDHYFQGRQKEIKRQRTGQIRIFVHEPLHGTPPFLPSLTAG